MPIHTNIRLTDKYMNTIVKEASMTTSQPEADDYKHDDELLEQLKLMYV